MKVLITGGNGYIASSLYSKLKDIHDVFKISRQNFDLRDSEALKKYFSLCGYFDVVIHTAVEGGSRLKEESADVLDSNLTMYYNLLKYREHYGKFIHFGSGAEDAKSLTPYGMSKKVIRQSMENKPGFYDIRIYGVFDQNELNTRLIKGNILRYIKRENFEIHCNKRMTFFYMDDLAKMVNHIMQSPESELAKYNYASYGEDMTLFEIAEYINTLSNYKVPTNFGRIQDEDYVSPERCKYGLEYEGLKNGIQAVYNALK
jgi:nucleoside-diphosphate-sugar epimerase